MTVRIDSRLDTTMVNSAAIQGGLYHPLPAIEIFDDILK
jgi:hypothetical protein